MQENTLKRIVEENLHLILSFLVKLGVLIIIQLRRPALILILLHTLIKFAPSTAPAAANAQHDPHVAWPFAGITAPGRGNEHLKKRLFRRNSCTDLYLLFIRDSSEN